MKIAAVETFQLLWGEPDKGPRSAFVRIVTDDGLFGLGEASPMKGGVASLVIIARHMAPALLGRDALDHAILLDTLFHKLLGGAWRLSLPCYSSIGNNARRSVDEVLRVVERRVEREKPAAVKIRLDGDRTAQDVDIPGDIAKATAVRRLLGDAFVIGFDANNGYSVGGAMRVGRALEDLGYAWFEEPVQHYHVAAMGEVAQRLDITVSAGEQTYTLPGLKDLIGAGVRMVQPDIVKMGGITGLMGCAALAHAHGVELVPHQTQPSLGHLANLHLLSTIMHLGKPVELADNWERAGAVFRNPSEPVEGRFAVPSAPGLGAEFDEGEMRRRSVPVG